MPLPVMTAEQRAAALAKARVVQQERSRMIAAVRAGELSLAEVFDRTDDMAKRTRVGRLLRALPGHGPVAVGRVLAEAGVDADKRIGTLNPSQRARLLAPQG